MGKKLYEANQLREMCFFRLTLGILLLIIGLNAIGGAWYALSGAPEIPLEWLNNSPFDDYFIPGLFLLLVIGGLSFISAFYVFKKYKYGPRLTLYTSGVLLLWIVVQMSIIGYVSWLQPAMAVLAFIIAILALKINNVRTS